MITFNVKAGTITLLGVLSTGIYSGHGDGLNNPDMEQDRGIGPIPRGVWTIGTWEDDPHLGPCVARLAPAGSTEAFGRSGFFIHGDNARMNHSASDGCIIVPHDLRERMKTSGEMQITVV